MAIYTYEIDHGDKAPKVHSDMTLSELAGKVVMVEFGPALSDPEWLQKRIAKNKGKHNDTD